MLKNTISIFLLSVLFFTSCTQISQWGKSKSDYPCKEVQATVETDIMDTSGDSADDPAIWIHPTDASKSLIIGTNKKAGLVVYDLQGKEKQFMPIGRVNNVDTRYGFELGNGKVDIVAASNRSFNAISIFAIDPDSGFLRDIAARTIISGLDEVYGFCLYKSAASGKFYAFMNSKDGAVEQWELFATENNTIDAVKVRNFVVGKQTEGCVADDELGYLYIGEETFGIWKYFAEPHLPLDRKLVADTTEPYLAHDIEGLTIYYGANGKGYLIASVQGLNTYAIYERNWKNKFIGCFSIGDGAEIDGVQETDGIDVSNFGFSNIYPNGFFIAQDGFNKTGSVDTMQNFKIVPWERIAGSFEKALLIDNQFDIRK